MKLLVISNNYPSRQAPQVGTFVYKLIQEFVKDGNEVHVVAVKKYILKNGCGVDYGEELATVYRPKTFSFSNKRIGVFNTFWLTQYCQAIAIRNSVKRIAIEPDVVYCHFIVSALNYYKAFPNSKVPVFIAVGEYNNIDLIRKNYSKDYYEAFLARIDGFIAVSPQVQEKLRSFGVPPQKVIVEPNAVNRTLFKPLDKRQFRRKFCLPETKKIVLFVGRFVHDKGPLRVLEALNRLSDDVVGVFVGRGPEVVEGEKVVFKGILLHHEIPEIMSAADIFVLPTLHEGSSNVIVEAMSCGLPIVSSDIPEIRVQCDASFSILVDPLDVSQIEAAIRKIILDESVTETFSKAAGAYSEKFDLNQRALRILNFMKNSLPS